LLNTVGPVGVGVLVDQRPARGVLGLLLQQLISEVGVGEGVVVGLHLAGPQPERVVPEGGDLGAGVGGGGLVGFAGDQVAVVVAGGGDGGVVPAAAEVAVGVVAVGGGVHGGTGGVVVLLLGDPVDLVVVHHVLGDGRAVGGIVVDLGQVGVGVVGVAEAVVGRGADPSVVTHYPHGIGHHRPAACFGQGDFLAGAGLGERPLAQLNPISVAGRAGVLCLVFGDRRGRRAARSVTEGDGVVGAGRRAGHGWVGNVDLVVGVGGDVQVPGERAGAGPRLVVESDVPG